MELTLAIRNQENNILAEETGTDSVALVYAQEYQEGDEIILSCNEKNVYLLVQLDEALPPSFVYYAGGDYRLPVPFGEKRISYSPKTFSGEVHLLQVRAALPRETENYRNLAENAHDSHFNTCLYPHAHANVETRGESVFAARNAINGGVANRSHGAWPYESWGINRDPDAELTLEFGRPVTIDKIVLTTRADFPHDNWWKSATVRFSDGTEKILEMEKSEQAHVFDFSPRTVEWIKLGRLLKDETDPSPFPALTQIAVYGTNA